MCHSENTAVLNLFKVLLNMSNRDVPRMSLSLLKERVAGTYTYTKKQSFPLLNIVSEMVMIFHSYCTNELVGWF